MPKIPPIANMSVWERRGAWLPLFEGSILSGLLGHYLDTGTDHGTQFHHGAVPVDLSLS